jgi:hypothetical protein
MGDFSIMSACLVEISWTVLPAILWVAGVRDCLLHLLSGQSRIALPAMFHGVVAAAMPMISF